MKVPSTCAIHTMLPKDKEQSSENVLFTSANQNGPTLMIEDDLNLWEKEPATTAPFPPQEL